MYKSVVGKVRYANENVEICTKHLKVKKKQTNSLR